VTVSLAVFEIAIWVKFNVYDKIMIGTRKKDKVWKSKKYLHGLNLHLKHRLEMESPACQGELMPEGALRSFRPIVGPTGWPKKVSHHKFVKKSY